MDTPNPKDLQRYLATYVTHERLEKIKALVPQRTRHVAVVLEDMYQSHNAAATMRTCDALGVQDVHCIMQNNNFEIKKNIALGALKWLSVSYYRKETDPNPTATCLRTLKEQGYKIVATSPHAVTSLSELPVTDKIALLFGTEDQGLSEEALSYADHLIQIPMHGFVESFNVSVSVGVCLYDVMTRLRNSKVAWQLSPSEQEELITDWLRASIDQAAIVERQFYKNLTGK